MKAANAALRARVEPETDEGRAARVLADLEMARDLAEMAAFPIRRAS